MRTQQLRLTHLDALWPRLREVKQAPAFARLALRCSHSHSHSHIRALASDAGSSSTKKDIAIIGGGLGGLTAARVLQKHGFNPVVFEREPSQESRQQGGTLDLHPQSGQWAVEQAGLMDEFRAKARPEGQDTRVMDKDGTVLWEETGSTQMDRPETDRPVLRGMLLDSLQQGTVKWGHHMTAIKPVSSGGSGRRYMLEFSNGHTMQADVVIGADGGRSRVRSMLTDAQPSYQGVSALETSIPDVDRSHPEAAKTVGKGTFLAIADNKGFIAQRQGNGHIRIYVNFRIKENGFADLGIKLDDAPEARSAILANFDGWAPEITNLVKACDGTFRIWPCYALPVGLTWQSQPSITLLGDAAHLMSPFAGEGANTAMQDGAELALALVNHSKPADAIAAYEATMFARAEEAAQESAGGLEMCVSVDGSRQYAGFLQSVMGQQPGPVED